MTITPVTFTWDSPPPHPLPRAGGFALCFRRGRGCWVRFFGRIQKRICDLRSFGSWCIKGTDESLSRVDSSVPLMHRDPNDLRSQIRFWILPKKPNMHTARDAIPLSREGMLVYQEASRYPYRHFAPHPCFAITRFVETKSVPCLEKQYLTIRFRDVRGSHHQMFIV